MESDSRGNLYIADSDANRILKVTGVGQSPMVNVIAGTGAMGNTGDNGPATSATLNGPRGVTTDSIGNVYISDYGNNVVRRIALNGTITTIAGTGAAGFSGDGGPATAAAFNHPTWAEMDSLGNLYVSDFGNSRIRVIFGAQSSGVIASNTPAGTNVSVGLADQATGAPTAVVTFTDVTTSGQTAITDGVSLPSLPPGVSASPLALSATASSGLAVTFSTLTASVCSVAGSSAVLLSVGTCTIAADQSGNSVYAPAIRVAQSLNVTAALLSQTITFPAISAQTLGAPPFAPTVSASSGLPVTLSSSSPSVCAANGSVITLVTAGFCSISATQPGNATYAAAPTVTQIFSVLAGGGTTPQTITFASIGPRALAASPLRSMRRPAQG